MRILATVFLALYGGSALAASIVVDSTSGDHGVAGQCVLRDAITAANSHTATGGCPAGTGNDTITLPAHAQITLSEIDNTTLGANGLPPIEGTVVIEGNGATLQRSSSLFCNVYGGHGGTNEFRFFVVKPNTPVANLTLRHLTLTNGCDDSTNPGGGAIYNFGVLALQHVILSSNATFGMGGAVFSKGDASIDYTTFLNNSSKDSGGAIADSSDAHTIVIDHSLFQGNKVFFAPLPGGAIYHYAGTMTVRDTTFSGNHAEGSAIYLREGPMSLSNVTIADNDGTIGISGGIDGSPQLSGVLKYKNTLLNNNTPHNCGELGLMQSAGGNLSSDTTCEGTIPGVLDLKLGPLANGGGESDTYTLLPGSPAIDASTCLDANGTFTLVDDQRGRPRPYGGACDIGAYERDDLLLANGFEP